MATITLLNGSAPPVQPGVAKGKQDMDIPYDEKAVDFCKDCGGTGEKTVALKKQEDGWICKKCNGDGWVSSDELPDLTYLDFMELILLIVGEAWRVDDDGYFPAAIGRIERLCIDHISRCKRQPPRR